METTLDLSRWREAPHGVGYRRWVIASAGLRQLLGTRIFRLLLLLGWLAGLLMAMLGFAFTQTVATGGWMDSLAETFGVRAQAVAAAVRGVIVLYPDVCIGTLYTCIFWLQSFIGLGLSLIALTAVVPRLVTRDRASNALTIYLSRPLTSADYLLGKLGIILGVLVLLWTGPLVAGWVLSLLFSPNRDFLVYSLSPLSNALLFNGIGLVVLAAIALGVSALNRSSRNTIILWIGLWLIAGAIANSPETPLWLQRASFTHDLMQVRQALFRLDEAFIEASAQLPFLGREFTGKLRDAGQAARATDLHGALGSLSVFVVLSSVVFLRKLRPE